LGRQQSFVRPVGKLINSHFEPRARRARRRFSAPLPV
jgi:hypothetical protein